MSFRVGLFFAVLLALVICGCDDGGSSGLEQAGRSKGGRMSGGKVGSDGKVVMSDKDWKQQLTAEQYRILRQKGTERAFSGEYDHSFEEGTYLCAGCGEELFTSEAKYDSGCGWPAFTKPANAESIDETEDRTLGMVRTEVTCSKCGGHLGHVFNDGSPEAGGLRYCINSASLEFEGSDDK